MANSNNDSKKSRKNPEVVKFKNKEIIEKKGLKKVRMGDCEICGIYGEINQQRRCKRCKYLVWKFSQNKGVIVRSLKRLNIPDDQIKYVLKEEWNMLFNSVPKNIIALSGSQSNKDNIIPSSPSSSEEQDHDHDP